MANFQSKLSLYVKNILKFMLAQFFMPSVLGSHWAATTAVPGLGTLDRKPRRRRWGTCSLTFTPWQAVNCAGRERRAKGLAEPRPLPFHPSVVSRPIIAEQHLNVCPLWFPFTRLAVCESDTAWSAARGRKSVVRSRAKMAALNYAFCNFFCVNINSDIECEG